MVKRQSSMWYRLLVFATIAHVLLIGLSYLAGLALPTFKFGVVFDEGQCFWTNAILPLARCPDPTWFAEFKMWFFNYWTELYRLPIRVLASLANAFGAWSDPNGIGITPFMLISSLGLMLLTLAFYSPLMTVPYILVRWLRRAKR